MAILGNHRRFSLLLTASLLGVVSTFGWLRARPEMSGDAAAHMRRAAAYYDSLIVLLQRYADLFEPPDPRLGGPPVEIILVGWYPPLPCGEVPRVPTQRISTRARRFAPPRRRAVGGAPLSPRSEPDSEPTRN